MNTYNYILMKLDNLKPTLLWKYFYEICQIPRASGNTKPIAKYLSDAFSKLGYKPIIDSHDNVFVRKPATDSQNKKSILLQGHSDMVAAKTDQSNHDFSKDPIETIIDGNFVRANKTSLGADNGIGVAIILAIFADKTLKHGPLEALITTNEEIGMLGAINFDSSLIESKYFINLDWEDEKTIAIGCPGMIDIIGRIPFFRFSNLLWPIKKFGTKNLKISITGGLSGHSGAMISEKRINAIKQMFNILNTINVSYDFRLLDIEKSGVAYNAIPPECTLYINTKRKFVDAIKKIIENEYQALKIQFNEETNFKISCELSDVKKRPISKWMTKRIISFYSIMPNGINTYNHQYHVAETSSNIGLMWIDGLWIENRFLVRSPYDNAMKVYANRIRNLLHLVKGKVVNESFIPGWVPKHNELANIYESFYDEQSKEKVKQILIGGGVEPAYIVSKHPEILAMAIGPNIYDVHTPNEHIDIVSTQKIFLLLVKFLQSFK